MHSFYAFLFRMKYINRWGLMSNSRPENAAEHSHHTVLVAHALAVIENTVFGNNINADRVGMLAAFHETGEVLTGDLPTPIKYYSDEIRRAYQEVESAAETKLLQGLPDKLKYEITQLVRPDKDSFEYRLVKCADKLTAYIKCIEELKSHNNEFKSARDTVKKDLLKMSLEFKSVKYFMKTFIDAFNKTLDELT